MQSTNLFCDGACSNTGGLRAHHGGWAAILVVGDCEKILTGHNYPETNSTAEIKSLLLGLEHLSVPCPVGFFSDSQYIVKGVNIWLNNWISRDYHKVEHADLWRRIAPYRKSHSLHGTWIRGHAIKGKRSAYQEFNVRCDELAVKEAWKSYREVTGKDETGEKA